MLKIEDKIIELVKEAGGLSSSAEIKENYMLIEDLGFDSVSLVFLLTRIEEEFGIEFEGSDMLFENYNRIESLHTLIRKYME